MEDSLPLEVDIQIRKIHAKWLERDHDPSVTGVACCREAYDVLARHRQALGQLSDSVLESEIPAWLFDIAVFKGWCSLAPAQQPAKRLSSYLQSVQSEPPWIPDSRDGWIHRGKRSSQQPPAPRPTIRFGSHNIRVDSRDSFLAIIEGRIEHWKAHRFDGLSGQEINDFVIDISFDQALQETERPPLESIDQASVNIANPPAPPPGNCDRAALIEDFLEKCNRISSIRILKRHIWLSAGHGSRRQFEYWQACSTKATGSDHRTFSRIISDGPAQFLQVLRQKRLIKEQ